MWRPWCWRKLGYMQETGHIPCDKSLEKEEEIMSWRRCQKATTGKALLLISWILDCTPRAMGGHQKALRKSVNKVLMLLGFTKALCCQTISLWGGPIIYSIMDLNQKSFPAQWHKLPLALTELNMYVKDPILNTEWRISLNYLYRHL